MKTIDVDDLPLLYRERFVRVLGTFEPSDILALCSAVLRETCSRSGPQSRALLRERLATMLASVGPGPVDAEFVDSVIDECLGTGDLIKVRDAGLKRIALTGPGWVRRASGAVFLIGDFPEVPGQALRNQSARGAYRVVSGNPSDEYLGGTGRLEIPMKAWLIAPSTTKPEALVATLGVALERASPAGGATMDLIFDMTKPPDYFRGRLVTPRRETGQYLGRRKVRWGAAKWSYCELDAGQVARFVDLPIADPRFSGRDEWYWAAAAIERVRGTPGSMRAHPGPEVSRLSFRSPIPSWAERRLLAIGDRHLPADRGALMTFNVPSQELPEELQFLKTALWLEMAESLA